MARLHEYQGKAILSQHGLPIPRGSTASSPDEAAAAARAIAGPSVLKIQAWTTGRAALGGVAFADSPQQASEHAKRLLAITVGNFPVTHILVEEKLAIAHELFVSLSIDDRARAPVILLALAGGTGIEDRAAAVHRLPCDLQRGPDPETLRSLIAASTLPRPAHAAIESAVQTIFNVARAIEARSVEINPLVITTDNRIIAADCRMTVDDYAVFRHPELGIDIARELDHPPTELERIAYQIEQDDHRGTFYFAQMNTEAARLSERGSSEVARLSEAGSSSASRGLIGFHGAGGGGSMMSMDAITAQGFTIANFCDTSGNPSPAKVYRAARIILSQPGLIGYFGSGSGVANQEQFWSAYGLAKAFWELNLDIPAVIRLGGNTEDRAVDILQSACKDLPAKVECYRKTDTPAAIAARFAMLVEERARSDSEPNRERERAGRNPAPPLRDRQGAAAGSSAQPAWRPRPPRRPPFVGAPSSLSFPVKQGRVWIDPAAWISRAPAIIARSNGLLKDDRGKPALTITPDAFLMKDSDMIACEVECRRDGVDGLFVELEIPGLDSTQPHSTHHT
ncbi:MAG: acetate--CoA ligase family protein [Phycisphaerales bacterium]|nr:acetate--CoA ligase family protein [Phycisphaerales bacterium]